MSVVNNNPLLLELRRRWFTSESTIGELWCEGKRLCFILEDVVRPDKVYGKTAIPAGEYEVLVTWSPRFQRMLPILVDVPNYQGVRIHPGNTADDTEGCLLPGEGRQENRVLDSRKAFARVFKVIGEAVAASRKVVLRITGKPGEEKGK